MKSKKNLDNIRPTPQQELNKYYDPDFTRQFAENSMSVLTHHYFRSSIHGLENLPQRKAGEPPRILYSNHSGMSFPWDAIVFSTHFWEKTGYNPDRALRAMVAPLLSSTSIMNPFLLDNIWKRCGGVDATLENFDALMRYQKQDVLIYPEGVPGIGKGYDHRYEIQKFSTSFLRMAIKYKAEIVPFYTINAEFVHPFAYRNDDLNRVAQKLGIPMVPLSPITGLVPIFPFLFYLGLPAKMKFFIGKPISVHKRFEGRDLNKITRAELVKLRDDIHDDYQREIDNLVAQHGQDPYEIDEFVDNLVQNFDKLLYLLPSGWPLLFIQEFRAYYEGSDRPDELNAFNFFASLFQNLTALPFMLPFVGWPILYATKDIIKSQLKSITSQAERTVGIQKQYFKNGQYIGPERRFMNIPYPVERRKANLAAMGDMGKSIGKSAMSTAGKISDNVRDRVIKAEERFVGAVKGRRKADDNAKENKEEK